MQTSVRVQVPVGVPIAVAVNIGGPAAGAHAHVTKLCAARLDVVDVAEKRPEHFGVFDRVVYTAF